jgi:hypothetical protein
LIEFTAPDDLKFVAVMDDVITAVECLIGKPPMRTFHRPRSGEKRRAMAHLQNRLGARLGGSTRGLAALDAVPGFSAVTVSC